MRGNFVLTEREVATLKRVPEHVSRSAIIRRLINALEALLNESGEASLGYIMSGNIELLLKEDLNDPERLAEGRSQDVG